MMAPIASIIGHREPPPPDDHPAASVAVRAGQRHPHTLQSVPRLFLLAALTAVSAACVSVPTGTQPLLTVPAEQPNGVGSVSVGLQLLVVLTVLSLIPALLIMVTSFTRVVIVLSFIRLGVGAQVPPTPVLLGLSLFLTVFIMAPVWQQVNEEALQPYLQQRLDQNAAVERGLQPLRNFMLKHTREKDLALFLYMGQAPRPRTPDDVPTQMLVPAFIVSELKTAFQMGFLILAPFLIIDLVISIILMSMGMMMLPPTTIALPFKVLLFVLVDGWHLLVRSLVVSYA